MSRRMKIICAIMFSFSLCFIGFGYAALTDVIELVTNVSGEAQNEVFITNVLDPTSNAAIDGFYSTMLDHNINLAAGETATYTVQLYNNSKNGYTYIYDGHTCYDLPEGVTISVVEKTKNNTELVPLTTNVISSLIEDDEYDYFEVIYTNTSDVVATITNPIKFNYTKFTDQIKIVFEYDDVEYIKYSGKIDNNVYEDVVFDQIPIVLNEENRVARCNNNGLLETETTDGNTYLKVTNITNYKGVAAGEEAIYCDLFSTLTSAVNYNAGKFLDDSSPNGFVVLQNLGENVESLTDSMYVINNRNYRINLNSKDVLVYKTIMNAGKLKIYDSNNEQGILKINDEDLLHNLYKNSVLTVDNVRLNMNYTVDQNVDVKLEFKAIVVGFEGLVEIFNSNLNTNYGYGVYKRSLSAGTPKRVVTSYDSKILVENTTLISDYNNAVRFSDGTGIISLVNSYVASSINTDDKTKMKDPIFACKHPLETGIIHQDYYENAMTDMKIFITGGTLVCNKKTEVNHFYSNDNLHTRIFYTASAKFETVADSSDHTIAARTNDESFTYPVSMINGSESYSLYMGTRTDVSQYYTEYFGKNPILNEDDTINTNHYMNKDGWYYIYCTMSSNVKNGDYSYQNKDFVKNAEYEHLMHNGKKVMVGDYFEMINFNSPGESYINVTKFLSGSIPNNDTGFYGAMTVIPEKHSQGDYDNIENLFTFLVSGDERYYNIVSLAKLDCVFHIENAWKSGDPKGWDVSEYNVGIKFLSTTESSVELDHINQRFTIMKYDHANADSANNNYPYIFVSKFGSTFSYLSAKRTKTWDENGKIIWDKELIGLADVWITGDNATHTVPGYLDGNGTPYSYKYDHDDYGNYLMSNATGSGFQRNGWYLWQDTVPKSFVKIWHENYYYNLMTMGAKGTIKNGSNVVDSSTNTVIYVSSEAKVNSGGVYLSSNHSDGSSNGNDWGYLVISSDIKMEGISFHIKRTHEDSNDPYSTKLYAKLYDQISNWGDHDDIETISIDIEKTDAESTIYVTVMFDTDKDIHMVRIDPFDMEDYDNTMALKTVCIIGAVKEYLK